MGRCEARAFCGLVEGLIRQRKIGRIAEGNPLGLSKSLTAEEFLGTQGWRLPLAFQLQWIVLVNQHAGLTAELMGIQ